MKMLQKNNLNCLLSENLLKSTGCTEPIAIAYATATARKTLSESPASIELKLSGNMAKNAMDAGIPGTKYTGAKFVAALAALSADPSKGFELLGGMTKQQHDVAYEFSKNNVEVQIANTDKPLYIEVILKGSSCKAEGDGVCTKPNVARVVVYDGHTAIKVNEYNGKSVIKDSNTENNNSAGKASEKIPFSMDDIFEYVDEIEDFGIFKEAVEMNLKLSNEGKKGHYGLEVGKAHPFGENAFTRVVTAAAAGVDARMAGADFPATACTGSGNQGITVTLPIYQAAKELGKDDKTMYKAVAVGILSAIYVKQHLNVLSYLCGAVIASSGAAAGMTYLYGGNSHQAECAIQNVLASVTGMFCDGAKSTCALKVAACVSMASFAANLAMKDTGRIESRVGIACENVSGTIENVHVIEKNASEVMDSTILNIITK